MATSLEHMLASGEGFPENGEFEDLVINGRAAKMRINLPSKTKISKWCQQTNTSFPVYEVKFFKQQDESYHMARVSIEGKTSYGKAEGKKMAENSAAFRFLNGDSSI
jgi:dsRNA-specific ribonuclease